MNGDAILGRMERLAEHCGVNVTAGHDRGQRFWAVTVICRGEKPDSFTVMEPALSIALARAATEATARGWANAPAPPRNL